MHEATWLKLMRTSFVLFCLIPTLGVFGWAAWEHASFRTLAWEHSLRPSLGLIVRIDRVSHPKPGQTRFEGVQLFDPETRERVAVTSRLDATDTSRGWRLHASQLDVTTAHTMNLWRIWHDSVLREDLLDGRDAELKIDRVSFTNAPQVDGTSSGTATDDRLSPSEKNPPDNRSSLQMIEWKNVRWTSELAEAQRRSRLEFHWSEASDQTPSLAKANTPTKEAESTPVANQESAPISVSMRRVNESGAQQTHILLDTASARFPLSWLAEWMGTPIPSPVDLHGTLQIVLDGSAWKAQLKGQLENVDLAAWSRDRIPYQVAGRGHLELMDCHFSDGGIQDAWGKLNIEQGVFDRRLFEAMIRNKLANPGPAFVQTSEQTQLAGVDVQCTFRLNQFGFVTQGEKSSPEVAARNTQGILLQHRAEGKHLDALVRALVYPATEASIEETQKLYRVAYRLKQWLPSLPPELERKTTSR